MNSRPLTPAESANLKSLNDAGLKSTVLFVTATGLRKSILDATEPMRRLFGSEGFHDYSLQAKGPLFKVQNPALILAHQQSLKHKFPCIVLLRKMATLAIGFMDSKINVTKETLSLCSFLVAFSIL